MGSFETRSVDSIKFIREQDGSAERILKAELSKLFQSLKGVTRAYLTMAEVAPGVAAVVLAVSDRSSPRELIVQRVGTTFSSMFKAKEALDIIFLSEDQEKSIRLVCNPFYVS